MDLCTPACSICLQLTGQHRQSSLLLKVVSFSNSTALSSSMSTLISYELVLVASLAARTALTVTFLVMSLLVLVVLPNATRGEGNYKGLRKQTSQNLRGEENLLATVVRFSSMLA